jgi:hypothetical protein
LLCEVARGQSFDIDAFKLPKIHAILLLDQYYCFEGYSERN